MVEAIILNTEESNSIMQGDIFTDVKYSYILDESDVDVHISELVFPLAVVISQACDVKSMSELEENKDGKATKYMPSILMCPIYDSDIAKTGDNLDEVFEKLNINLQNKEPLFSKHELDIARKSWHYRFHFFNAYEKGKKEAKLSSKIIDFKHYFTVPMSYLLRSRNNRIGKFDDVYSEQITLKFATFLARVPLPDLNSESD
jgi:hypothetical protein